MSGTIGCEALKLDIQREIQCIPYPTFDPGVDLGRHPKWENKK